VKTKAALKLIERCGGVLLRTSGSHRIFKFGAKTLIVPYSGHHLDMSRNSVRKLMKALNLQ
jgi:predicted RNA binding protein YcfA (HicA-like mRNA interferase family)